MKYIQAKCFYIKHFMLNQIKFILEKTQTTVVKLKGQTKLNANISSMQWTIFAETCSEIIECIHLEQKLINIKLRHSHNNKYFREIFPNFSY